MYLVNQRVILLVKLTTLIGVPLLCSFLLPWLSFWRLPASLLVFVAFYLNNLYPDRIYLDEQTVKIKLFLYNEWLEYKRTQVQFQVGEQCIYLYVEGTRRYRLSMERLSVRLYNQLVELMQPYVEL